MTKYKTKLDANTFTHFMETSGPQTLGVYG